MTGVSLARIDEHLDRCMGALSNVGADGVNQLQMHLRLLIEWSYNLDIELKKEMRLNSERKELLINFSKRLTNLPPKKQAGFEAP
ncbi:hypothetical protein DP117_32625 [Brasilonema sp. UFV-L1]|uniref:hypothetical protein n=1 Tax=Brasilonema sp. UFV-L1 TaxID=2234130 RepID=UPI0016997956|nr:hypothetical protein [Brasilonema sp. UFV-L1]